MKHPAELKIVFNRKIKIFVVVSTFSIMSFLHSGCSAPNTEADTISDRERFSYNPDRNWNSNSSNRPESPSVLTSRGIVTTFGVGEFLTAAVQVDGKVVVAGGSGRGLINLVRYRPNGNLDTTFGQGGIVRTPFYDDFQTVTNFQVAAALVIQPDGKILCAGTAMHNFRVSADYNRYDFALARYNPDGSLDATFGTNGLRITDIFPARADVVTSLALQTDGKIVAAGFSGARNTPVVLSDFVVVRYNTDGTLDPTFGTGGIVVTDIAGDSDFASSLVIQPDGQLVVGGFAYGRTQNAVSFDFALARYNPSGSPDPSFGSGGKVLIDLSNTVTNSPGDDLMFSMVRQPDGKLLCAGSGEPNRRANGTDFLIARFNPNGSLDTTFGTDGKVMTDFNGTIDEGFSIALQPNGKFVVAGVANGQAQITLAPYLTISATANNTQSPTLSDFALARYNADGSLDKSFATGGKAETDIGGRLDAATKVLIMPSGNILALGVAGVPNPNGSVTDFATSVMYQGTVLQRRKLNDFDGDGIAEFAVFRPSDASWRYVTTNLATARNVQFGAATDKPAVGDYDGDGRADLAVFRSGSWNMLQSSDNATRVLPLGQTGDRPVQDDYDGDGKTDIAVWRASNGTWYWQNSGNGQFGQSQFGQTGDIPVNGDYDGDGRSDLSYFHPADGTWHRVNSSNGAAITVQFGADGDKPVVGDYDGDGIFDFAVFRPGDTSWRIRRSTDGTSTTTQFGLATDIPVPADYDGDRLTDIAVFRPSDATWQGIRSSGGTFNVQFGASADIPVPAVESTTPAAIQVSVSGRVTTPSGLGLRNAVVSLIDSNGVRRTATTSSFGIYSFNMVRSGETYTLTVSSKRYRFSPQTPTVTDTVTNVDFTGLE